MDARDTWLALDQKGAVEAGAWPTSIHYTSVAQYERARDLVDPDIAHVETFEANDGQGPWEVVRLRNGFRLYSPDNYPPAPIDRASEPLTDDERLVLHRLAEVLPAGSTARGALHKLVGAPVTPVEHPLGPKVARLPTRLTVAHSEPTQEGA